MTNHPEGTIMDNKALFRATIKAVALGEVEEAVRLEGRIVDADRESYHLHVMAMFAALVQDRFSEDSSHAKLVAFVNELHRRYSEATPPLRPLMMEGMIRVVFGEQHFLADIPLAEQLRIQYLTIRVLIQDSDGLADRIDDLITASEELAEHWAGA